MAFIRLFSVLAAILVVTANANLHSVEIPDVNRWYKDASVGERCSKHGPRCQERLICESHVCKIPRGNRCNAAPDQCAAGTICAGTDARKKCVTPRGPGVRCYNVFTPCADGLVCESGVCKTTKGSSCLAAGSICVDGTICVGGGSKKICVRPRRLDEKCDPDRLIVCKKNLVCTGGTCSKPVVPVGGDCLPSGSVCVDGSTCVGTDTKKVCATPSPLDGSCGTAFTFCGSGLECDDGTCKKPKVPEGGDCKPEGSVCEEGTVCIRGRRKKICVRPRDIGEKCSTKRLIICKDGLVCARRLCRRPRVPVGGDCLRKGSKCVRGAVCVGTDTKKICAIPSPLRGECGTDFTLCADGLVCRRGVCRRPRVRVGGDCLRAGSRCVRGSVCVGTSTVKVCAIPSSIGGSCLTPFTLCADGLDCRDGKCEKPKVPEGGNCAPEGSVCADGTVCVGGRKKKICVRPRGLGEKCSTPRLIICKSQYRCKRGICRPPPVPVGGDCLPKFAVCVFKASCVGTSSKKVCAKPSNEGGSCGTPFTFCESGLDCKRHTCVKPGAGRGESCAGGVSCESGLRCLRKGGKKICLFVSQEGGRCWKKYTVCAKGLSCVWGKCMSKHW